MRTIFWATSGAYIAAAMSGCRLWLHVDDPQCDRDQACVDLFGAGATCVSGGVCSVPASRTGSDSQSVRAVPARWSCVRDEPEMVTLDSSRKLRVRMDVVDASSLHVPEGLNGAACLADDVDCGRPVVEGVVPGGDGFMEFMLPYGFQGYFSLEAPDSLPVLAYNNRPYTENLTTRGPPMLTREVLDDVAAASGNDPSDPERGAVFLEIRDCNDVAGDGVRFDGVDAHTPFYFEGALPDPSLQQTAISNQLSAGREPRSVGGFVNLEPGSTTFQAKWGDTQEVLGRVTVEIKAGYITYVRIRAGY